MCLEKVSRNEHYNGWKRQWTVDIMWWSLQLTIFFTERTSKGVIIDTIVWGQKRGKKSAILSASNKYMDGNIDGKRRINIELSA